MDLVNFPKRSCVGDKLIPCKGVFLNSNKACHLSSSGVLYIMFLIILTADSALPLP